MIQLYTKSFDGIYEKVSWERLKVTPNIKITEAIEKFKPEQIDNLEAESYQKALFDVSKELGFE